MNLKGCIYLEKEMPRDFGKIKVLGEGVKWH